MSMASSFLWNTTHCRLVTGGLLELFLFFSRFVLMCYRGYVTAWNPAGTECENWPTKEHVTSGQGSRRVDRRSHNLLLCPPPVGGIKQCTDPSVCMSVRALSSKRCIFKPNSYYGTLTENVILVVEHIRTCPPELAETGGTCGFAAIDATICCLCIAAAAGIAWRYIHLFAQPLMLRLTLDWLVVGEWRHSGQRNVIGRLRRPIGIRHYCAINVL